MDFEASLALTEKKEELVYQDLTVFPVLLV